MALLNGDLEQERKNVVQSIISCKDPEKKASLVKKFKNFWAKEREERAARERELAELAEQRRAKKAAEDLKHDIPENILEFSDNGMTANKKISLKDVFGSSTDEFDEVEQSMKGKKRKKVRKFSKVTGNEEFSSGPSSKKVKKEKSSVGTRGRMAERQLDPDVDDLLKLQQQLT